MSRFPLKPVLVVLAILVIVALVAFFLLRPNQAQYSTRALSGPDPVIAEPEAEEIPSLGLPEATGWEQGEEPLPAPGLSVTRYADGLTHPRSLLVLPNGDVLVAETNAPENEGGGIKDWLMQWAKARVGAGVPSPDRIVLLRDSDGDGAADQRTVLLEDLHSPFGMALREDRLLVANTDAVLSYPFTPGQTRITGAPEKLMDLPGGGQHWVRNLLLGPQGDRLYVTVGSSSNIAEDGMAQEEGRAAIWEYDFSKGTRRLFAAGLRNPNGLAFHPESGELWTVVNGRDMLGPDVPPDYLTNVPVGAQYGWPWVYWKDHIDERVTEPMPQFLTEYTRRPEYALGAHTSPLGLVFAGDQAALGGRFESGAFIARHGSWNRQPPAGYDVVFVPFDERGNALDGPPQPVLTGFLARNGDEIRGRPVWLGWDAGGALLVSDDVGGVIWRVSGNDAAAIQESARTAQPVR